jgi:Ion channel
MTSSSSSVADPPMGQQTVPSVHVPIHAHVGEHGRVQQPSVDGYDEELAGSETSLGGIHGIPSHSKPPPQEPQNLDNVALPPSSNGMASTTHQGMNNSVIRESFKPQPPPTQAKEGSPAGNSRQNVVATPLIDQEKNELETMSIDMGEVPSRFTPKHNDNTRRHLPPPPTADLLTGPRRRQSQGSDFDNADSSVDSLSVATTDNDSNTKNISPLPIKMTLEDIQICQQLDDEYERALEEREVGYTARYNSVRQSAFFSVLFMVAYLLLGTAFFMRQADWTIADSLLFSIYTITTVGYGSPRIPRTPGFQLYIIFYVLIGIAALTIMVRINGR